MKKGRAAPTATHGALVEIEKSIAAARHKHNDFLKASGLSPLPHESAWLPSM